MTLIIDHLDEVCQFLKKEMKPFNVVVMPDFFLDRLVTLNQDLNTFSKQLRTITKNKGGSIDGIAQTELRGGNAVNTASALASLGVKVFPIVCTSKFGLQILKFQLRSHSIDFSHVKIFSKPSITTALELETKEGKANIMLRNVGSLADFGPHYLNKDDMETIENADYICVFNWAGTKNFGTELAETVFQITKTQGKGKTYYDTADPLPNKKKIPTLVKNVLKNKRLDILSVNENEAIQYAKQLNNEESKPKNNLPLEKQAREAAKTLAKHLYARIDLHTTSFSATYAGKKETISPAFKVPALRATGAGDAWNAGNILGDAHRLSDSCRLTLANATAAYYIADPCGKHPTRKQLLEFCEKMKRKTKH